MVQKLWCSFLKKKMESEMKKYHHLEEAFQKIRTSTGNSDVQEMVHKFLTREQTYAQLLMAVNENEGKLDVLRVENDKKSDILHSLKMENDSKSDENKASSEENQEIIGLQFEINSLQKDLEIMMQRKKNIHLVVDQVSGWTNKVMNKLST